ncbi:MAG: hypothetical protein COV91_02790 [Candidatus Taylorbacteria bacterium CG11_big_fil_rev_8_21_14_0_20_46_11]|uniref:Uncharacterized protein n=1 Tax=Candidatus Taylorbacteria bacterium CG11_big_fil_rev_8_21_14_0_20_46_11 TaxID=1975025 RepID=A0A2H0KBQ7_9BACT|nr:MAG: hypothetical protein COV91_02790 [Candidatus Taylorbacteria bacterium CG11_big_fil_rev_8_21_14_0_20_46_11]
MKKRYWLKGTIIGFLIPIVLSLLFVALSGVNPFSQDGGYFYVFVTYPATIICTIIGFVVGYVLGKIKKEEQTLLSTQGGSGRWKKIFRVLVVVIVTTIGLFILRLL